ncbi:hypothetical protein I316_00057 [Kwoniella heveanensis BCC8398]|uniref:Uncharacterized protein n=1 Tax=Kwoniella heveanensis BCC8398 TaxID=1296120 RepID=A0A1B9H3H9_9TREE|nr:hypothetical protein I316_00057 [Kwoniella heveanensis BCC8398]
MFAEDESEGEGSSARRRTGSVGSDRGLSRCDSEADGKEEDQNDDESDIEFIGQSFSTSSPAGWQKQLEEADRKLDQITNRHKILGSLHSKLLVDKHEMETQMETLREENTNVKKELRTAQHQVKDLGRQIVETREMHREGLESVEERTEERMRTLCEEALKRALEEEKETLEKKYREEIDDLNREKGQLKERLAGTERDHQSEIEMKLLDAKKTSSHRQQMAEEINRLRQQKSALERRARVAQASMDTNSLKNERLKRELDLTKRNSGAEKKRIKRLEEEIEARKLSEECSVICFELFRRQLNKVSTAIPGVPTIPDPIANLGFSGDAAQNRARLAKLKRALQDAYAIDPPSRLTPPPTSMAPTSSSGHITEVQGVAPTIDTTSANTLCDSEAVADGMPPNPAHFDADEDRDDTNIIPKRNERANHDNAWFPSDRTRSRASTASSASAQETGRDRQGNKTQSATGTDMRSSSKFQSFPADVRESVRRIFDHHPYLRPPPLRMTSKGIAIVYERLRDDGKRVWDDIIKSIPERGMCAAWVRQIERDKRWDFKPMNRVGAEDLEGAETGTAAVTNTIASASTSPKSELVLDHSIARWSCLYHLLITEARKQSPDHEVLAALISAESKNYKKLFPPGWKYL